MRIYTAYVQPISLQTNLSALLFCLCRPLQLFHHILHPIAVWFYAFLHPDMPQKPSKFRALAARQPPNKGQN